MRGEDLPGGWIRAKICVWRNYEKVGVSWDLRESAWRLVRSGTHHCNCRLLKIEEKLILVNTLKTHSVGINCESFYVISLFRVVYYKSNQQSEVLLYHFIRLTWHNLLDYFTLSLIPISRHLIPISRPELLKKRFICFFPPLFSLFYSLKLILHFFSYFSRLIPFLTDLILNCNCKKREVYDFFLFSSFFIEIKSPIILEKKCNIRFLI